MKNKDKHLNQGNYLSSLLVGGTAVGASKYLFSKFGKGHIKPGKRTTFVSPKLTFSAADVASSQFVTKLTGTLEGASLAKLAWKKAIQAVDPNASQTLSYAGNIDELEGAAVGSAIELTMSQNQSLYMGQVFSRFKQNVGALSKHHSVAGSLPQFKDISGVTLPAARSLSSNQLPGGLRKSVNKIKKALGTNFAEVIYHTREGWESDGFGLYSMKFNYKGKQFDINLPSVRNGLLVEGRSQSSKRIAPSVAIFDPKTKTITSTMPRDEYFMENFQRTILPNITSDKYKSASEIQGAIQDLYTEQISSLQSIPNTPSDVKHEGLSRYINVRNKAIDIRVLGKDGYREPTDKEFTMAMKAGKFFPSTSGKNLGKGRVSLHNPAEQSITPGAVDFSRSPGQANREWMATPDAVQAMMDSGRIKFNKLFDTPARSRDLGINPALRTLYIDPSKHKKLLEAIRLDDGESLMSNRPDLLRMSEVSRQSFGVHLKTDRADLKEIIAGNKAISPGEMLGWTTEGTPFTFKSGMKLQKLVEHDSTGKGEYITLHFEETMRMAEHAKKFGDIKAVERLTDPNKINREVAKRTRNKLFLENIERWAMTDDMRKDKSKHNKQMITAMWEVMSNRQNLTRKGQIFANNPRVYSRMLENKIGNLHTDQGHKEFIKGLMKFGLTDGGLNPEEFGYVFGAVPSAVGKKGVRDIYGELAMNEFSFRHMREMYKGFAGGMSQTVFNASDAGGHGSLEPRAFELLQSGQYGALGQDISQDLMGRMIASNPSTLSTHEALTKTLSSLAKKTNGSGNIWDIANQGYDPNQFQQFIENGGGFIRSGKGLNDIYVPGASEAPGMSQFKTSSGNAVKGKLAKYYHDITNKLSGLYANVDTLTTEDASKAMGSFASQIQKEQAPLGKGMGSLLRDGGILGSRRLTIISEAGGQYTTDPWTVGVPEAQAGKMFDDLIDKGMYDLADVKAMSARFYSGEKIGGVIGRDPNIGPYSLQPVNFEILRGVKDPVITIPSNNVNLRLAGQQEASPVNISALIGMGADKDADTVSAFLVAPDLEKKIRQQFTNQDNEYTKAYMQHNVRMQLVKTKAKSGILDITNEEKMIADAKKLGTAQSWAGKLSTELSVMRQAASSNMKDQQSRDALFLIEWIEQQALVGKHLDPKRVLNDEMSTLFSQIQSAGREKNAKRLEYAINDMLKNADDPARKLLTQAINIEDGSQAISQLTGVNMGDTIPSINLQSTTENIMSSLSKIEESGLAKISRQLSGRTGKKGIALDDLTKYLSASSKVAESGAFNSLTSTVMANKNNLLSMGLDAIKNNKAKVGFGFLGALAIGAALSSPKETIGPAGGILATTKVDHKSRSVDSMNIEPQSSDRQPLGNPSAPDMLRARRSMIQPGGNSARMSVRATTTHNTNINRIVSDIRSNNRDSNVSINVRDSSSILNLHGIANKVLR